MFVYIFILLGLVAMEGELAADGASSAPKKRGAFAKAGKILWQGPKKLAHHIGRPRAGSYDPAGSYDNNVSKEAVAKSRHGIVGKLKTKAGISEAAVRCRVESYPNAFEAQKAFSGVEQLCNPRDRQKFLDVYCPAQCSQDKQCQEGCGALCRGWVEAMRSGGRSHKQHVVLKGVEQCAKAPTTELDGAHKIMLLRKASEGKNKKRIDAASQELKSAGMATGEAIVRGCATLQHMDMQYKAILNSSWGKEHRESLMKAGLRRVEAQARAYIETLWGEASTMTIAAMRNICTELGEDVKHVLAGQPAWIDDYTGLKPDGEPEYAALTASQVSESESIYEEIPASYSAPIASKDKDTSDATYEDMGGYVNHSDLSAANQEHLKNLRKEFEDPKHRASRKRNAKRPKYGDKQYSAEAGDQVSYL